MKCKYFLNVGQKCFCLFGADIDDIENWSKIPDSAFDDDDDKNECPHDNCETIEEK